MFDTEVYPSFVSTVITLSFMLYAFGIFSMPQVYPSFVSAVIAFSFPLYALSIFKAPKYTQVLLARLSRTSAFRLSLLALSLFICSCASAPYRATNKFYRKQARVYARTLKQEQIPALTDSAAQAIPSAWVGSVNFNMRKPNFVIIHYTAQTAADSTLRTFTLVKTQVSAHYLVGKDGKVYHLVNDYLRAYHAGLSKWGSVVDMNSCSLGIEIDNNGNEPFNDAQINSLLALLAKVKKAYNIPTANFIGHEDVAPRRKPDPGPYFPWKKLAAKGFGYWHDDAPAPAPANFDYQMALRLIGYDTADLKAAIVAFKRHFVQTDVSPNVTQTDLDIMYNVFCKYQP